MDRPEHSPPTQDKLIGDLRLVIHNAEELLKNTGQNSSVLYQAARAKLSLALTAANAELARFEDAKLRRMMEATNSVPLDTATYSGEARIMRAFRSGA